MSLRTVWSAARSALAAHVNTAWGAQPELNSLERSVDVSDLPYFRIATNSPITISPAVTPPWDTANLVFTIAGLWARPAGETDLEDWAMEQAENLRALVAGDHHLGNTVTDCSVTDITLDLPDLDPNDNWVGVLLNVAVEADYER